jgi:hypothetical protein
MSDGGKLGRGQSPPAAGNPASEGAAALPAGFRSPSPATLIGPGRLDAVAAERKEAVAQIHRSLKAWRSASQPAGRSSIPKGTGAALGSEVRKRMEPKLGADLSNVRVHTGGESSAAARGFGARAFTVGDDIHFDQGEFSPGNRDGDRLLAHELTHVVQGQKSGVQRKEAEDGEAPGSAGDEAKGEGGDEAKGEGGVEVSKPEDPAEKEADAVGDQVADQLANGEKGDEKKADGEKGDEKKADGEKGDEKKGDAKEEKAPPIAAKLDGVGRKVYAQLRFDGGAAFLNNPALARRMPNLPGLIAQANVISRSVDVEVQAGAPPRGKAAFQWAAGMPAIIVQPLSRTTPAQLEAGDGDELLDRALAMTHELQHCIDAFQTADIPLQAAMRGKPDFEQQIHGEWRAMAQQAKSAADLAKAGQRPPSPHRELLLAWKQNTFDITQQNVPQSMFGNTSAYIVQYTGNAQTPAQVQQFISSHQAWVQEAFQIMPPYTGRVP